MSIGLPAHLMASTSSRSFVRASHAIAITCLAIAILTVLVFQADRPGLLLWPAGVAVLPMLALLLASARRTTAFYSVAYLVVGGASTYWYAVTFFSQLDAVVYRDVFSLALLHIALLMVGGPGVSLASGLAWSGTGLVIAELASALASAQTGHGIVLEAVEKPANLGAVLRSVDGAGADALIVAAAAPRGARRASGEPPVSRRTEGGSAPARHHSQPPGGRR